MADAVHDAQRLAELQALPLERKIQITQARILEWNKHYNGKIVVSFSGGKDSTVLLNLVRRVAPDTRAVFSNTGLEYAEIQRFVKSFDNVDIVTPKMRFDQVISTYGYPLISKEVAEAIYYARRIRSQNGNVERERAEPEEENAASFTASAGALPGTKNSLIQTSTARNRRTVLQGKMKQADWKRLEIGGGQTSRLIQTSSARNRRTVLSGRMPGSGVGNGKTGEGGVFSNPVEQFGEKSQFNKEKYLPLARDVPVLISHLCCMEMKKKPMHAYQRKNKLMPILGTMAEESRVRKQGWIRHGCNAFESKNPTSQPLSFWTGQDVLAYIVRYNIQIASVYGEVVALDEDGIEYNRETADFMLRWSLPCCLHCTGCQRTGCVFCGFGFHNDKGLTRFQQLALIEPRKYEYAIGGGQWADNPYYDPTAPKMDGEWQNWNPKKIWVPSKKGLGMGKVFDMVNEIYGKDFYRYE